ncbi:hypothetical protein PF010_g12079 [Phytophthora fragariae]|uniref:No apical meristem-associated C-terminal domain-containing protein n=1 Tax=Phytophthora fragariae TaxID=53985 RepID=A0A6A3YNU6_9STRA|nr:hypothetical protein PF003_g6547 [Phytophthora fragariae]KAE8934490.1 hypothetical protein PF009_g15542 [Phytophthora fragariae]KAE9070795.1 hypothetical protein PF007_g26805 [Phytophthora fragariae]KAE9107948.1 hypothetical protein PF010_g12079 [Phytophthora fragariae]KAE9140611.1 hypothetical protein PF006_g13486 [Phytophthora fragariae]
MLALLIKKAFEAMSRWKGKNFTEEEEALLCRTYLRIGKDPTTGTSQSSATFWEKLTRHFNEHQLAGCDIRPLRSLESKWSTIQHDVSKFCGCMATVQDLDRSGTNFDDDIDSALQLYQSTHTTKGAKDNKPFRFLHCWRVLSVEPKWKTYRASNRATRAPQNQLPPPSGPSPTTGALVRTTPTPRPEGNKAAKKSALATATIEHTQKRLAEATMKMANASQKRARALEEANHYTLFTISLSDLDADAQEFFRLRRAAILNEMRSNNHQALLERIPISNDEGVSADSCPETSETTSAGFHCTDL